MFKWLKDLKDFFWSGGETSFRQPVQENPAPVVEPKVEEPKFVDTDAQNTEQLAAVISKATRAAAKPRTSKPAAMKPKPYAKPRPKPKPKAEANPRKSPNVLPKAEPVRRTEDVHVPTNTTFTTDFSSASSPSYDSNSNSSGYSGGGGSYGGGGSSGSWDSGSSSSYDGGSSSSGGDSGGSGGGGGGD